MHVLERDTGLNLPFGFGIKNLGSFREDKLGTNYSSDTPKAKLHKRAMIANELTASADVAISRIIMASSLFKVGMLFLSCQPNARMPGLDFMRGLNPSLV